MRRALVSFVGGAIAATFISTPSQAEKIVWNTNLFGPPRAVTAGIEAMRDFYLKQSNGEFEIKLNYGSALGPERQAPEALKSGGYEVGMLCAGCHPDKFPLLAAVETTLPRARRRERSPNDSGRPAEPGSGQRRPHPPLDPRAPRQDLLRRDAIQARQVLHGDR